MHDAMIVEVTIENYEHALTCIVGLSKVSTLRWFAEDGLPGTESGTC